MKITKLLLTLIAACMVFASCNKSSDNLPQVIPANTMYIVNINTQSLVDKSAYNVFDNIVTKRGISVAQAMMSSKEAMDMFDAFVKDVNSIGLNIKGDSYIYTDYSYVGMVIGVNNADKIKDALVNFVRMDAEDIKKDEKGIYSLSPDRNVVVCWDNEKLLFLGKMNHYRYYGEDEQETDLMAMAKKQLSQKKEESILSNSAFSTFLSEKKDISVFYSYANFDFIEKMSGMEIPENIKSELDQLKGISSLAFMSFEKGEIKATSKICYPNSDVEKKYKDLTKQLTGDLKGDQLKYIQENPLFFITASLKGSGIYEYLGKLGLSETMEHSFARTESGVDLKTIFSYFDGDITFSARAIEKVTKSYSWGDSTHEYESTEPMLAFLADVNNTKEVLKLIVDQMDEDEDLIKIDDNTYTKKENGLTNYFGIKENTLFYTNDSVFFQSIQSSNLKNNYSSLTKNNVMALGGNISCLKQYVADEIRDEKVTPLVLEGLNLLGDYSFTTSKELSGEGKIVITDNSKNSLAVICQYFDKVLTTINDEIKF